MNKKIPCIFAGDTEMEGFEPSRVVKRLPHFECGPFSHLGTSPYGIIDALRADVEKSRG